MIYRINNYITSKQAEHKKDKNISSIIFYEKQKHPQICINSIMKSWVLLQHISSFFGGGGGVICSLFCFCWKKMFDLTLYIYQLDLSFITRGKKCSPDLLYNVYEKESILVISANSLVFLIIYSSSSVI